MEKFTLRIATKQDAKSIRQVQHDTWISTYPNEELGITIESIRERVSKNMTEESINRMQESMDDPNRRTWLVEVDSKVVGYCAAVKGSDSNLFEAIYVLPEFHGRGVGKLLIEESLTWLGNKKDIRVEVASYNDRAINFYKKYGFKDTGKTGSSGEIPTIHLNRKKK